MSSSHRIGLGGGCHWCTEAVFQAIVGVETVEQGWIRSAAPFEAWSEAVVVHFDPEGISLDVLVEIHLATHASTSDHALRGRYRSAVYTDDAAQHARCEALLARAARETGARFVTRVLPFEGFRLNKSEWLDYYRTRPGAPFCTAYIDPKLALLRRRYAAFARPDFPSPPP